MGINEQPITEQQPASKKVHIDQEINRARTVFRQASKTIHTLMLEIKRGNRIDINSPEPVIEQMIASLERNREALLSLCRNKQKDDYIFKHAVCTSILATAFAMNVGYEKDEIKDIALGALLGDIGKIFIPSDILNKPGKLTDEEFHKMKQHAIYSQHVLKKLGNVGDITFRAATEHHERFDGSGYPYGLSGKDISTSGKIAAIVDVYDAMTSHRTHQSAKDPTDALKTMLNWRDTQFDGTLMKQFIQTIGIYPAGTLVALNNGTIAVVIEQSENNLLEPIVRTVYDLKNKRMVQPFEDIDVSDKAKSDGLKILTNVPGEKFNFNPLSALG